MDYLLKALVLNETARVYVLRSTDITNETIRRHDLWPSAASVLSKAMSVGLIMGAMLKGEQALTIKIDGNGPIGQVVVDANANGDVRGYVTRGHISFRKDDGSLADNVALGYNGYIDVIKDLKMKELFTSSIQIATGDIAKDFTYYFMESEQTPSVISLGTKFDVDNTCIVSGGIIIQLLPNATEETIVAIEEKLDLLSKFSETLIENSDLEDILKIVFGTNYKVLETKNVRFKCTCSEEKFKGGLVSLGKKELQEIIEKDGKAEVVCHYCNERYTFSKEQLIALIKEAHND